MLLFSLLLNQSSFVLQNGKYTMDLDHFRELHADYTWSKDPKTFGKYAYGPIDDGKK